MAKAKKFGTFSGVFTPSILTILGVIMYLRFPQIIGQAGLINTIGIIVIAHIISITTSLSVASLSTDKPVQNGGTYFMISRSLGLPIGGTLGLALFVGLSFSVSLYLIGFAESFLQYWGFESTIENIRLTGTLVLIGVTTITFISTSLAIKSQYFIMAAIVLSLLSIFFGSHEFTPKAINLQPLANAAPFMLLFGIFFPAVTGFEAGVSMSGDLQNPKKALPTGAILAVGVGFIVYMGLAIFYAKTVDAEALMNDPQILFKISLVPGLVIAGIWGATLSSALGSILGAPRILQAIAMDKIAPGFFARGTGKTNEPRNALLLAFVIAEAGILIGELDLIARIVSMFFITTYAFLNLASAIESWSSSDFRPAFKIPKFVSILGTLSAFIVMILLDFLALAGAIIVLGFLYLYLQRKELILESGDAWSSFWTNLAKRALLKLNAHKTETRNWRPNIVLFSGGITARPHLIELGLSLTGKLGALTDFNLVTEKNSNGSISEATDLPYAKIKTKNYFSRRFECQSVEKGIQLVTSIYGFSGFEPNTVLMGWSRDKKNAEFLSNVLMDLKTKNLNALFLEYDKRSGFGKMEQIDIWWNGKGRHLSFSLNIVKFLLADPKWRDAEVRIMVINNDTSLNDVVYRNISTLLSEERIPADIKIINNDFGTRSTVSLIKSESGNTDLLVIELSHDLQQYTPEYIDEINKLAELPCTTLLLKPTDVFESLNVADSHNKHELPEIEHNQSVHLPDFPVIENPVVKSRLSKLDADLMELATTFLNKCLFEVVKNEIHLFKNTMDTVLHSLDNISNELKKDGKNNWLKALIRNQQNFLRNINNSIQQQQSDQILGISKSIEASLHELQSRIGNYIFESSETIHVSYLNTKKNKEKNFRYFFKKSINHAIQHQFYPAIINELNALNKISAYLITGIRKLIFDYNDQFEKDLINIKSGSKTPGITALDFTNHLQHFENDLRLFEKNAAISIQSMVREISIQLSNDLSNPATLKKSNKKINIKTPDHTEYFQTYSENWEKAMTLMNNTLYLDTLVLMEQKLSRNIIQSGNEKIIMSITNEVIEPMKELIYNLQQNPNDKSKDMKSIVFTYAPKLRDAFNEAYQKVCNQIDELPGEFELPEKIYIESDHVDFGDFAPLFTNIHKTAVYYIDTLFYEPFYRDLEKLEKIAEHVVIESKEANSLLLFKLNNIKTGKQEDGNEREEQAYLLKLVNQVKKEQGLLENALNELDQNAMKYLEEACSNLYYHAILESEKKISTQKREQQGKKLTIGVSNYANAVQKWYNNLITTILHRASTGIILS